MPLKSLINSELKSKLINSLHLLTVVVIQISTLFELQNLSKLYTDEMCCLMFIRKLLSAISQ